MNTRFSHNTYLINIWMISSLDMFCMHQIGSLVCLVFLCAPQSPRSWPEAELHNFGLVAEMLYLYTLFIKNSVFCLPDLMRLLFEDAISIPGSGKKYEISAFRLRCFRGSRGRSSKRGPSDKMLNSWICRNMSALRHLLTMSHPGHCPIVHRTQAIKKGTLIV